MSGFDAEAFLSSADFFPTGISETATQITAAGVAQSVCTGNPEARDRCFDFKSIFGEKKCEKMVFLTQNRAKLCKIMIITLVFEKNANFFAENCLKSQKIVIITSTQEPG
jgi:hypothetical protein